jgi:hypothetical protein
MESVSPEAYSEVLWLRAIARPILGQHLLEDGSATSKRGNQLLELLGHIFVDDTKLLYVHRM